MSYEILSNFPVFGIPDPQGFNQMTECMKEAEYGALMADHHMGYAQPIGGVVAYKDKISPIGVGYDIACGNKAVSLVNLSTQKVRDNIDKIMDEIWSSFWFGTGGENKFKRAWENFDFFFEDPAWDLPIAKSLRDRSIKQFGTIGGGNHYIDLFTDEIGMVWIGVHFGSRGLGYKMAEYFLKEIGQKNDAPPVLLDVNSDMGAQYLMAMKLAGRYAYAGRDWVCEKVAEIVGGEIHTEIHNHHNYAWEETHNGEKLWVVRKGATPAFPGQQGFVGGSMAEPAVIIEGIDSEEAKVSLYSTVHGAGRVMSRTAALGYNKWGKKKGEARVTQDGMMDLVNKAGVTLRGAGLDEAPQCYKRLNEVLDFHNGSIKILHTLTPIGVAMAENDDGPE